MKIRFRWSGWLGMVYAVIASFVISSNGLAFQVEVSEAPKNDLSLTLRALGGAKNSLLINMYEFTSSEITDVIINRIESGIHVEILEEGNPVGGLSPAARQIKDQLVQAMKKAGRENHFYEMTSKAGGRRRFTFDHAKYTVIDNDELLIGSENYTSTGHPSPETLGSRGWEVLIHEPSIAKDFSKTFYSDSSIEFQDVIDRSTYYVLNDLLPDFLRSQIFESKKVPPVLFEASHISEILSPDNSLSGILALLNNAKVSIDLELMTFSSTWGKSSGKSPLFNAVVSAARRGVSVRVLLNDEDVFSHSPKPSSKNKITVQLLNELAKRENLKLNAKIADVRRMGVSYIHNKGGLVDGDQTLISSINWNENSVVHNREAAVVLTSPEINAYYKALFNRDWAARAGD